MGPELLVPLLISGGGMFLQQQAAQDQADERRSILNRQLEREGKATDKAAELVEDEGKRYSQQARQDALAANEQKSYEQAQADLQGAGGASISTVGDNANVSDDFIKTKATRAVDEGNRLTAVAREAAKARAPGMMSLDDSLSMAGMAGNMGNLWGRTKNMSRATSMDAEAVESPDYGALGTIASAVGNGMAAGGYGRKTGTGGVNFGGGRG